MIRVVITGSECTGKSTLAKRLGAHFNVPHATEHLREYFSDKDGVLTINDAIPIAKGQLAQEQRIEAAGHELVICDTNALSSIIYSRHYFGECPDWIESVMKSREYHHYFLCGTDVPWKADGQRDRPDDREYMQGLFREALVRHHLPFTELSGPTPQRLKRAIPVVEGLLT